MAQSLGGLAEVAINGITIRPDYLSEVSVELTEGTRERSTLAGTFTRPSGTLDTATAMFTLYLPSIDYLKDIFPARYNAPTAPQTTGNIIWDVDTCTTAEAGPVNIHYTCEETDANDVYFYQGEAQLNFNPTYTATDDLTIEVTVHAVPNDAGQVYRLGTGDLTEVSIYDAETQETVPVAS
jgi:hypothetical protein